MAWSIRARLTLWYTGVLVFALLVQGVAVYVLQERLVLRALDEDVRQDLETVSHSIAAEFEEGLTWRAAVGDSMREMLLPDRHVAVFCGGALIGERPRGAGAWMLPVPRERPVTRAKDGVDWRIISRAVSSPLADCHIIVARPMTPVVRTRAVALRAVWTGLILAVTIATAGGFWLARRGLRPLTRLADECTTLTETTLQSAPHGGVARLTMPGTRDELDRVVEAFNGLLARLEHVLDTQRQFMADASHELRTPVSVVRASAEVALSQPHRTADDYRDALDVVSTQARRMSRLVDDLFLLARVDAGQRPLTRARVYFDDLVRESVDALAIVARGRGVTIDADIESDVEVDGDEHLLRQLIVNVLQNAVSYTRPDSRVAVRLHRVGAVADLAVTDAGPGVPDAFRDRIFERFVRLPHAVGDASVTAATAATADATATATANVAPAGGAGLGLAIARVIAELHGGTLTLRASDATGSTFAITLPAAAQDVASPRRMAT